MTGLRKLLTDIQPDLVVHLAAVAFVGHGAADAFYQVNLIGTRNLLEAIAACGKTPECVLLASSANVYGNASSGMLDEATVPSPATAWIAMVSSVVSTEKARTPSPDRV